MSESVSGYDLTAAGTQDNQERVVGKDCVRKHRNKLRDQGCTRLDLWVEGRCSMICARLPYIGTYRCV
jgi:hypothetical protein